MASIVSLKPTASLEPELRVKPSLLLVTLLLAVAACESDIPTEVAMEAGPHPAPVNSESGPDASALSVWFVPSIGFVGDQYEALLTAFDSSGVEVVQHGSVTWTTSDPSIATIDSVPGAQGRAALISPVGIGVVTIVASSGGLSTAVEMRSLLDAAGSDALAIDSFAIVEFYYPPSSGAPQPYYAPQILLREQHGLAAEVIAVALWIPGMTDGGLCSTRARPVAPNGSLQLFPEVYGDFELTFDRPDGRAADGPAAAVVYFVDGEGHGGSVTATGSVTPGDLPTTYTGRMIESPWRCGYAEAPF